MELNELHGRHEENEHAQASKQQEPHFRNDTFLVAINKIVNWLEL